MKKNNKKNENSKKNEYEIEHWTWKDDLKCQLRGFFGNAQGKMILFLTIVSVLFLIFIAYLEIFML